MHVVQMEAFNVLKKVDSLASIEFCSMFPLPINLIKRTVRAVTQKFSLKQKVEMGRNPSNLSPKKQSFFKVLLGDFSNHLRIPPKFTKNYIRPSLGKCVLRSPSGKRWDVELKKREDGLFFHNDGWQRFVKDHRLQLGDFLVFHYDDVSKFNVTIYDRTCCEKEVEVAKKRSCSTTNSSANEGNQLALVKDEIVDLETINYNKDSENADKRRRNNLISGKRLRVEDGEETSTGSIMFKSANSCFKLTLKARCSLYRVLIPKELAVAEGLMSKNTVDIEDPSGTMWPAKLVIIRHKQNNKTCDRLDMSTGWGECCKANRISLGDTVVFELVKQSVMRIHIFRRGPGRRGGNNRPSVVLDTPNNRN